MLDGLRLSHKKGAGQQGHIGITQGSWRSILVLYIYGEHSKLVFIKLLE